MFKLTDIPAFLMMFAGAAILVWMVFAAVELASK